MLTLCLSLIIFILVVHAMMQYLEIRKKTNEHQPVINTTVVKQETQLVTGSLLVEKIRTYLSGRGIKHWLNEKNSSIHVGFDMEEAGLMDMFIHVTDTEVEFGCLIMDEINDEDTTRATEIVTRLNQLYNFGKLVFFYETRIIVFKHVHYLFESPLSESKFNLYFDWTLRCSAECREPVYNVIKKGEEPVFAMLGLLP